MQISHSVDVPGTPIQIAAALLSEELAAARARALGIESYSHAVSGTSAKTQVSVPSSALPAQVGRFLTSDIAVTINAVADAVAAALAGFDGDWKQVARELVRRRFGEAGPKDLAHRRKAADLLARRGFDADTIRAATRFDPDVE